MEINKLDVIKYIEIRVSELQKSHVSLQEAHKDAQHHFEHDRDAAALQIIDILDMIETVKFNRDFNREVNPNAHFTLKKIEKKLTEILRHWKIQAILLNEGQLQAGKTRVLETRKVSEGISTGTIIEVCRKGYQRGDKTIRPADVITAE